MIVYKKASLKDVKFMQNLVQKEVEAAIILHRSEDEIATNIRSYILAFEGENLVGYGALHIHSINLAEVRSLVVDERLRGKGVGKNIVLKLIDEAKFYGLKEVFSLTYQRVFFEKLGFYEIPKQNLPEQKIWADCIKCKHFPVCDEIAMIFTL